MQLKPFPQKVDIEPLSGFDWPEFTCDRDRIKANTERYSALTIPQAFASAYNTVINTNNELISQVPREYEIGDLVNVNISSISRNGVVFTGTNLKKAMVTNTNLWKYEKFRHFIPTDTLTVKVVDVRKDKVVVDMLSPMFESWINGIRKDPSPQKVIGAPKTIRVKNLQLVSGGFTGKAVIPNLSEFVGEEYMIDAFIPGSQIVLNITDNFEQFIGTDVDAFVTSYIPKPGAMGQMSLVCSAKEYIKFQGELGLIELFKAWCDNDKSFDEFSKKVFEGTVTGVINSSKRCGAFVEVPDMKITGMVRLPADTLVNYKRYSKINVSLTGFDEDMRYDEITGQMQHADPYVIENGVLKKVNIKPVLSLATE